MIEVEIRARVNNPSSINRKILKLGGKYIGSQKQIDAIFGRKEDLDAEHKLKEGSFVARIRQKDKAQAKVEFKEISRQGAGKEFSFAVLKFSDGKEFLEKIGFNEAFSIIKTRKIYKLKGLEVSLDKVEKLGDFIEIEKLVKLKKETSKALQECKSLLVSIDPNAAIEPKKYGDLMQELINKN